MLSLNNNNYLLHEIATFEYHNGWIVFNQYIKEIIDRNRRNRQILGVGGFILLLFIVSLSFAYVVAYFVIPPDIIPSDAAFSIIFFGLPLIVIGIANRTNERGENLMGRIF